MFAVWEASLTFVASALAAALFDYDGHPFVTNPAPVLQFQRKVAPTPTGIGYEFAEQTAHGVALLSRFPAFTLSDRRIHVDGQRSKAYTIEHPHGRSCFYDAWQLPAGFQNFEGKHVWLRATDLLGVARTWRGDWRERADNNTPSPPDFR